MTFHQKLLDFINGCFGTNNSLEREREKMMNTRVALKSCYVCHNPVFPEDKIAKKRINGVDSTRHLWHRIPNSGSYFYNLDDAKSFLEKIVASGKYSKNSYVLAESNDILEDIERLKKIGF